MVASRRSEAYDDLGGQKSDIPLTPGQEDALYSQGLGNKMLRQKVERRQRRDAKAAEDAERFSPVQQAINRAGLEVARKAIRGVTDEGISDTELAYRTTDRIAHGRDVAVKESEITPMTASEKAFIGFEQGEELYIPRPLLPDSDQPLLFDEEVQLGVKETESERSFVDIEALEAIMKALSVYKQVVHAEEKNSSSGQVLDGMKSNADKAIREAYPYFDRLLNVWLLKQQGYTTDQIGHMRYEMIKKFKKFANETTSTERKAFIEELKKSQTN